MSNSKNQYYYNFIRVSLDFVILFSISTLKFKFLLYIFFLYLKFQSIQV